MEYIDIYHGCVVFSVIFLMISYAGIAVRIRAAYICEHAKLFPGFPPYRLESFLLDFADKNRWLVEKLGDPS